jgi:hypothetical protein
MLGSGKSLSGLLKARKYQSLIRAMGCAILESLMKTFAPSQIFPA